MNSHDLSYIAGFFDGEGSVFLAHKRTSAYSQRCRINIAQNDPEVLRWIQAEFGGRLITKRTGTPYEGWQLIILRNEEVVRFAQMVGPYCRIKRERLRIAAKINGSSGEERTRWIKKFPSNHKEAEVGSKA